MKKIPWTYSWLAAGVLLAAVGITAAFTAVQRLGATSTERMHTDQVRDDANRVLSELKDAETGARGYVLTGDEKFLEPYVAVRGSLTGDLRSLRARTRVPGAAQHLDAVAPLLDARLSELDQVVALRRDQQLSDAVARVAGAKGRQLMDSIRVEIAALTQLEEAALAELETARTQTIRELFGIMFAAIVLATLSATAFAYLIHRQGRQRLAELVHQQTRRTLAERETSNHLLEDAHRTLQESEDLLSITLQSIGDAVITTDAGARVTSLNPVAEQLTGWSAAQAAGRPIRDVFHIVNKDTRKAVTIPVVDALATGTVQGLANHTVLVARDGREYDIADSCAPIRDRSQLVVGAVLVFRDVTQEYAVQQSLRDGTALVQAILGTVVDGVITLRADGGALETVNPAAERMFAYSAAELGGRKFSLLIPELDQDQRRGSLAYYGATDAARASGRGREVTGRRRDGSLFPLEITVSEMALKGQRYFTAVLRDITARRQVEDALTKAGALQNAIFNSANFSSIATDARGVIQIFNVGAERMLGYVAAEVMNTITPADISDPQELLARAATLSAELGTPIRPGFEALVFKASRGIEDIYELTYIRKDGSRLPAAVSVTALRDAQEAIIGYLLIGTDNTARRQIEEERTKLDLALQQNNIELTSAKLAAERANLAKSDFLSSMSHELRTPLNAILGFTQLLESGTPSPTLTQKRSLEQILHAGWYLLELINEILDLALIESGRLSLSLEPVALAEVMKDCQAMVQTQAIKRSIRLSFPVFEAPIFIQADRTRVKQVMINLLSNAIKYNRVGGSVAVDCSAPDAARLRIRVTDTGEGLPPEKIAQLFQPFNRLGQEAAGEEGTGIGLVVCKRLVETMGGSIGMHSEVGRGCAFWIELQTAAAPASLVAPDAASEPAAAQRVMAASPKTLLYVEDNPANLMLVEDLVARRGNIRFLSAMDGHSGVELAIRNRPDVILMDINLPGLNGLQALRKLALNPLTAHIPVIALSANAMPADIARGLDAGFFRYITKPIRVPEFLATLDEALHLADPPVSRHIQGEET